MLIASPLPPLGAVDLIVLGETGFDILDSSSAPPIEVEEVPNGGPPLARELPAVEVVLVSI